MGKLPGSGSGERHVRQVSICRGRFDQAIAAAEKARSLDPLALRAEHLGWILFMSRRYKEAIGAIEDVLATRPDDATALWELGFARLFAGQPGPAIEALERAADITNRGAAVLGVPVQAYGAAGRSVDASRTLDEMHRRQASEYVAAAAFVNAYVGLHDGDRRFSGSSGASLRAQTSCSTSMCIPALTSFAAIRASRVWRGAWLAE